MAALEGRWPKWVQELVAVLTGMYYPNVPHEKWFEMSNHLRALAEHYEGLLRDVSPSAALVSDALEGPTAEAFKAHVHKLKATLPHGVAAARDLSESLRETAVQVQYAKYMILVQLLWLAYTIVELVAFGLPEVAVAVTRGVAAVLRQIARQLVRAVATGAAVGGLMELGVQLVQMWQGFRDRLSWKDVFLQAGWGGVGGGLTALFGEVAHMYPVKPLGGALRDMSVGAFVAAGSLAFDPGQYKDDGAAAGESVAAGFLGSLPSGGRRGHGGSGPRLEALGGGLGWTLDPRLAGTGEWGDFHGLELPADGRDGAGVRSVWQSAGAGTGGDGLGAGAAGGGGWRDAAVRQGVPQPLITGFEGWVNGQGGLPERVVDRLAARAVASYVAGDAAGRAPGAAELHRWAVEELAVHRAQEGLDTVFGRWRESSAGSGLDDGALVRVHRYAARSLEERLRTGEYVPAVAGERSAGAAADRVLALAGFGRDQEHAGYGAALTAAADRERRIQGALGGFDRALAAPVAAGDAAPGAAGAGGTAPAHLSPLGHAVLRRAFAERLVAEHDTVFGQPGPFAGDAAGAGDAVRAWDREVRRQLDHLPVHTVTQAARELAAERAMDLVRTAAVDGTWLHGAQGLGEGFVQTFGLTDAAGSSASAGHVQQDAALHLASQAGHRLDHWTAQALQTAAGSAGSALLRHLAGVVGVGTRTGDLSAAQVVGQAVSEQGAARHLALAVARERAVSGAQGEAGTLARAAGLPAPLVTRVVGHHAQTVGELFDATFTRPDGDGPGGPGPVDDRLATWTERRTVLTRDLTGALAGGSGEPAAETEAPPSASAPFVRRLLSDSPATMPGTDAAVPGPGLSTETGPSPLPHTGAAATRGAPTRGPAEASAAAPAAAPGTARTAGAATATAVPADAVRPAPAGGPGERPADAVPPAASDRPGPLPPAASDRPGPLDAGWDAAVREARAALEPYDRTAPLVRLAGSALARYAPQPLVIREPDDGYAARHEEAVLVLAHHALGLGLEESGIGRLPEDHSLWQHAESLGRQLTAEGIPFDPSRRTGLPGGSHALAHPAAVRGDDGSAAPLPGLDPLAGTARTPGTSPGGETRATGPADRTQDAPDAAERPRAADHADAPLSDTEARERREGKGPAGPWGDALKAAAGKLGADEADGQREATGEADPVQDRRVRERGRAWQRLASARGAELLGQSVDRGQEKAEAAAVPSRRHGFGGDGLELGSENWAARLLEARTSVDLLSPSEQQSLWRETAVIMQEHYPAPGTIRDGGDDYVGWFDAVAHVVALELLHDTVRPIGEDHPARLLARNLLPQLSRLLQTPLAPSAHPLLLGGSRARAGQQEHRELDRTLSGRPSAPSGSGQGNALVPSTGGRLRHAPGMSDLRSGAASRSGARDAAGSAPSVPVPPAAPRAAEARTGAERGSGTGERSASAVDAEGRAREAEARARGTQGRLPEAEAARRRGQAEHARRETEAQARERGAVQRYEAEVRRLQDAVDSARREAQARIADEKEAKRRRKDATSHYQKAEEARRRGRGTAEQEEAAYQAYERHTTEETVAKRARREAEARVEQAERALSRVRDAEVARQRAEADRAAGEQAQRDAAVDRARREAGQRGREVETARRDAEVAGQRAEAERTRRETRDAEAGRQRAEADRAAGEQARRDAAVDRARREAGQRLTAAEPGDRAANQRAHVPESSVWSPPAIVAHGSGRPVGVDLRPREERSQNPALELNTQRQAIHGTGDVKFYKKDFPWGTAVDPFYVLVNGSPKSVTVATAGGAERLSAHAFAKFLAALPNLPEDRDAPIVLLLSGAGARGLELPRLIAHHTGRTVWSFTSVLSLEAKWQEGGMATFITVKRPKVGPEPSGWWIASRPEDIGPDPAAVVTMDPDPLGDIHHFAIVDAQGRPVGRIAHTSADLVAREEGLTRVSAAETYSLRTPEGTRGTWARQLPWRLDYPNTTPYFFSAHGGAHHISLALSDGGKRKTTGAELAAFLRRRPSFNRRKDAPIVLTSCASGSDTSATGLAQIVANETGRVVYGATTATTLGFRVEVGPDGQEGTWHRFSPARASDSARAGRARTTTAPGPRRAASRLPRAVDDPDRNLPLESDDGDLPEHGLWRQLAAAGPDRAPALLDSLADRRGGTAPTAQEVVLRGRVREELTRLPGVTVVVEEAANYGHQAAATMLMDSLTELGYDGRIKLVAPESVRERLNVLLPEEMRTRVDWDSREFDAEQSYPDAPRSGHLVLVAAADGLTDDSEIAKSFLDFAGADRAVVLKPYAWDLSHRMLYSRNASGEVDVTDLETPEGIADRALYRFHVPRLPGDELSALIDAQVPAARARGLKALVRGVAEGRIEMMPVYGLHNVAAPERASALGALARGIQKAGRTPAVVLALGRATVEFAPPTEGPGLHREALDSAGLPERIGELASGDVLIIDVDRLPQDVFRQLYVLGGLPAVLEGANTSNLVQLLGRPYFSVKTSTTPYDPFEPAAAERLERVTEAIGHGSAWGRELTNLPAWERVEALDTALSVLARLPKEPGAADDSVRLGQDEMNRLRTAFGEDINKRTEADDDSDDENDENTDTDDAPGGIRSAADLIWEALGTDHPDRADVRRMFAHSQMPGSWGGGRGRLEQLVEPKVRLTPDQVARLRESLTAARRGYLESVRSSLDGFSITPDEEQVEVIATAIRDAADRQSLLGGYFRGLADKTHDPRNDQVLQALGLIFGAVPQRDRTVRTEAGSAAPSAYESPTGPRTDPHRSEPAQPPTPPESAETFAAPPASPLTTSAAASAVTGDDTPFSPASRRFPSSPSSSGTPDEEVSSDGGEEDSRGDSEMSDPEFDIDGLADGLLGSVDPHPPLRGRMASADVDEDGHPLNPHGHEEPEAPAPGRRGSGPSSSDLLAHGVPGGRSATAASRPDAVPSRRRNRGVQDDDPFAEDQERRRDIEVLRNRLRELANTPGPDDATRSEEVRRITEAIRRLRQSVDSGDLTEFLHSPLPRLAEGLRGRQRRIAQLEEQMSGRGPGGDTREARDEAAALRREAERIQEEIRRRPDQGPLPGRLVLSAADMRIARILVAGKAGHREAAVLRQEANALGPAWARTTGSDGTGTPQAASLADRAHENWALHSALAHRQVWQRIDAVQATHLVAAQRHARRMRDADRLAARERLLRVMGGVHDPRPVAEDGVTDLLDLVHEHLDTGVTLVSKVPLRDADTGATLLDTLLRRGAQTPLHELLTPGTGTSRHGNGDTVGTPAALVSERWQRHGADDGIGIVFHWDSTVRERTLHTLSPHPDDPGRRVTPSSRYALIAHGPADAVRLAVAETDRFASDRELLRRLSAHKPVGDAHFPARVLGDLRWSDVHRVVLTHADTPSWRRAEEFAGRLEDFAARHGLSFEVSTAAVRETPLDGPGPAPGGPRSLVTDLSSADGARIVGRDYRPAGERSVVKPTGLDTATVAVAVPTAAPGTSPLYEPGERGPAPWAGSGPEPFFVLAWGTPEHITVQESGGRTAALSPERFADLLAKDPVMAGTPRDRAIVLAMPYGGAGGLDLPRLLAARTGREVWSSTGPLEIVPDVVDSRLTGVITQFPSDASVTRGWWVLSRPADGATAQAGPDALPRTDGAATATTDLVTNTMVGFDHRPIGRLSLPADFLARSEDIVDQGVWQATEGSSGQRFPWTGDVEAGRRPYFWMSHGWPTTVQMLSHEGDHHYPGAALGRYLRRRPSLSNLPADRPIVLLSCYTGRTRGVGERDTVVAQTVADATGRTVYAADSFVYVSARLPQGGAWHTFRPHRPEARQAQRALSSSLRDDGTDGLVLGVQDRSTRRETMSDAAGSFASADATVRNGGPADTHSRAAGSRAAGLQHSERTAPDGDPHAAGTKDPSPAGQTVRNHPTPDAPEPRPAPGDGVAPSSASPVRIDAELDTHRPPRLDRGMLPPAEGGRVVRFADGSRLPEYLTGDGGESRPATYGPSLVTLRGIDQVVREIGARTGLADSPAPGARGAMADLERALRETPWVFHGDGYESASFQDRGQPRVLRVVTRPHGNWERFADGYGASFKYENVDRSQTTTGLAKSLATSIRLSLGFSVGPPPGPVPAGWGRVGGAVGLNRSIALAQYDQTQKQDETRRGDASHVHLDDVQYEVHLAGPRPANRSSRPADAFSSGEAHFSFGVHSGLAVRLADGETTSSDPRSMADADRVPRSMTLGPHTDYRLVHTEGYGPVGEIRDWAVRRVGAQPGSSAYDEITGFFSSANFQRMADRLAHGPVATGQLVSDDRGRTPLGVFVVERVVPGEAHLVTGTAAAELRGTVQRAIRNERTVSKAYTQELNATAGPTMSFGRFFGGRAGLRVVAGVSARYARTIAHGTGSGGTGSRKTTGQAKKVPTYLYRVSRTVSVRWTGDPEAKTFDTWSLDRMTRTEARRHAGWDDGTTLRRRHDNEPAAPLYLPVDDPMTLGAARPEAFTHEDGSLVRADDAGGPDRTLLDGLLHQVLHRAARAYPGMIAPLADFGDPSDARWKDAEHYRMALQNTLTVMNTLSHHSLAAGLESLVTTGVRVGLVVPGTFGRARRWLWIDGRLTDRRYEGTQNDLLVRSSLPGTERLDGQRDVVRGYDLGVDVSATVLDAHKNRVGAPKNTGSLQVGPRWAAQTGRRTGFGATVSTESGSGGTSQSHLYSYRLELAVSTGGFRRPRHLWRFASLGLLGTQAFVRRAETVDLVGGSAGDPVTGRVLLAVPGEHTPTPGDALAVGPRTKPREEVLAPALAKQIALGTGEGGAARNGQGPFGDLPHTPLSIAAHRELIAGAEDVMREASGGSWHFAEPGALAHEALVRPFEAPYLSGQSDLSSGPSGMRIAGLYAKGPYRDRLGTLLHRVRVLNPRVVSAPVKVETEHGLSGDLQVSEAVTTTQAFSVTVSGSYGHAHPVGPTVAGSYGALGRWSRQQARALTVSRVVTNETAIGDDSHKVLVVGDTQHDLIGSVRGAGVLSVPVSLLPDHFARWSGRRLTFSSDWLGHVPEKAAHRMGLLDDRMGEVPRYLERTWELPPWQRDHQIGSYPVNALDATDVLRDFGRRLRGLGLDTAGLDRVQAMVGPRALRALREQLTSTGSATGLRVGALGLRPVWLGSRIAHLQVELIADETRFDGLGHGVTFKDGRQATETDETSRTDSRSATAGVNVGEGVRTADKVARAAGPTYAESGTSTQQVTQSRAVTRLRARGVEMDEPHAEYLTGYRLRIGLRLGSDRDVQVEGPVGRLRELVPLSLTVPGEPRSGADPLAAPQVVAPPPAVTVWEPGGGGPREQREALRARIDSWQAASGRGQAATPFRVPPIGFDVRRIVGLDAVRAAGEIALARAFGAPIGPRAGQADLSGPGLDEALAKARRTSLTRPGTAPALALHDGTSDTALAAFFDHSTTTEGLRVPGLTDDAFFSTGTRAELSFRSRTDLPGARLLAVMPSATMSGSERLTTSSDVAVTRAGGHEPVPGGGPSLDARSAGTAAPSASGSESTAADGDAVRYGAAAIAQTTRKPKTTRAFLFAIPATWVGVAEVERGFKDSPAGVWMHEHLGPFGPSRPGPQAVSAETQVIAWVREDIARELGLVTDDSFPPRVADAWEKVTRASTAWVDADKAYWKLRRTMPDSRAAYAQAHRDRTLAKSGLTDARSGADEPAARLRLREATARLHELRRELKEKWTGLTSRREAADQAAAEFHRVRAATDRLTRWHRLSAEERAGIPEPPAVDFAAPAATSPARSAGYTVGEGRLTAPDGTGYTLRDVPRDGGSFHHALAEGLRHLARDRQDGDTPAPGQPFTAERLRELLTARLGNAHDTDLLAFTAPDTKDAFGPAELHDAGIGFPDGSPERREYEDTGRLPLHHEPSASERVRLAALQLRRDPDPADPDTWDHGAADLLPALAARALGVRVTVVHGDGRSQDFAPPVQRTSAEHGTGPGERTPHVVLYLADRHFQSVIPDAAPTPAGVARPSMGKEPSTGRSSAAASPSAGPSSAEAGPSTEPIPPPRPTSVVPSGTVGRPRPAHTSAPWTGAASSTDRGRYRVTDGRTLTAPDGTVHDVREPSGDRAGNGFWEALAAAFHREPGHATSAAPRNAALDRAREPVAVVRARPLPASAHLDRDVPFTRDELTRAGVMLDRATARRFQDTGDLLPGHVTLTPGQERALVRTQLHTARHWDAGNEQAAVELAAASYRAALTVVAEDGTFHTHSTPDAVPGRTAVLYRRGAEYLLARPRTTPETAVAAAGARPGGDAPAPDTAVGPRPAQGGRPQAPRGYTLTRPAASDGARPQVYEVSRAGQIRTPRGEVLTPHGWVGSGDDYAHLPSGHVLRRATGRIERLWQPAERDSAFDELVARQGDGLVSYQLRAADDGLHVVPTDSEASNGVVFPWRVEDTGHH
ncbi:WXG100-like domain-containing protein [Streptomyces olivaceoviridis]